MEGSELLKVHKCIRKVLRSSHVREKKNLEKRNSLGTKKKNGLDVKSDESN